ncbi:gluconate kinase [Halobacillus andaensis]|uniref:Gluconate kinase n=1 Tax=Halobacillus andaensis TaxID=1176239 RepID=A0A917B7S9_HALAA|nr:gluconokinase [Halobacillus andaensis]MBP2005312.1 gluconokinase [Halobacillus andaensis]GGF30523.1 gluconate kinase [Halobacillus andaensis]
MTSLSYYLGVDIGTTSTKSVLFTKKGEVVTQHTINYPLHTPNQLVAEQDPSEILDAVLGTIRETVRKAKLNEGDLSFVSFSSAMHSLIAVDEEDELLTNSITWADTRSAEYARKLKEELNGHDIYLRTGTPVHAMSPLAKLMWMKEEKPEVFVKAKKFISIKEYVFHKLFGEYIVDHSIASATGLFNLKELNWDEEALQVAGITPDQLSTLVPTTHSMTGIQKEYQQYLGIAEQTPFIVGASDGVLSNLGVNAIEPGVIAVTIGTSGAIRSVTNEPKTDPKGRIFCYALTEDHWVIGGPVNNGGMVLRWLRDEFAAAEVETAKRLGIDPYDVLTKIATNVPAGSDGLVFHPFLTGERAPLWNSSARGSFFGLSIHHEKQHMVRAVLEGIIYNLYTVLLALEELTGEPQRIQATGGFARSEVWRQMMTDIFDKPVVVPESYESSCLGAIVLGMYATGEIEDFSIVSEMIGNTHTHDPVPETSAVYRELLPIYIRLSRLFEEEYGSIAEYQRKHIK